MSTFLKKNDELYLYYYFCYNYIDYTIGVGLVKACGLIVEYNPFHYGHLYHLKEAKKKSQADCLIAVMSGSFLQRGEPAIIDKFHRTKAALHAGVDIVIELPYPFAVQSSELFAKGAILSLHALNVMSICFGSESGDITQFENGVKQLIHNQEDYDETFRTFINKGISYPEASSKAYDVIGIHEIDMFQPNNILGFSYVKTIMMNHLSIKPLTVQRIKNHFHDDAITTKIASATSIRKELIDNGLTPQVIATLPDETITQLKQYKQISSLWHHWEHYFPYLHYRVITMSHQELANIHGVDEGLEYRIKKTAHEATSFRDWMNKMKTRRYTFVRLQRIFAHILMNTTKQEISEFTNISTVPYIRLLGMSKTGQTYLNKNKRRIHAPIITNINHSVRNLIQLDEKALNVYYSILPAKTFKKMRRQEFKLPIFAGT